LALLFKYPKLAKNEKNIFGFYLMISYFISRILCAIIFSSEFGARTLSFKFKKREAKEPDLGC